MAKTKRKYLRLPTKVVLSFQNKFKFKETVVPIVRRSLYWKRVEKALGMYDDVTSGDVIYYAKNQHRADLVDTIFHEILHGAFRVSEIKIHQRKEEEIVNKLSKTLLRMFRDNPELAQWLVANSQRIKDSNV